MTTGANGDEASGAARHYRVLVSGRVQGVGYREACRRAALAHGVRGWVRNLPEGTVEAVFEGSDDALDRIVEWCHRGPPNALVTAVDVVVEPLEGVVGFEVRL